MAKPCAVPASSSMEERSHRSRSCMSMRCTPGLSYSSVPLEAEHNEVSTLKPLLTEVLRKGRILTADAGKPLSRVWTAGQTGGRRRGAVRQRQYAQHPRWPGTLF